MTRTARLGAGSTASCADALSKNVAKALDAFGRAPPLSVARMGILPGAVTVGGVVSTTDTFAVSVLVPPRPSLTVSVTVAVPSGSVA